jgi:Uma2 family endonuclease
MEIKTDAATRLPQYFAYPCYTLGWKDAKGIPLEERSDLTVTELDQLGVDNPYDLIDGKIIFRGGDTEHAYFKGRLPSEIHSFLDQNPVGKLFMSLSLRLFPNDDRQLRTPDVSFYLNENCPTKNEYPIIAPDLVIEIVSVDDPFVYVLDNADLYLSKGSKVVWIVIPSKACVLVWTTNERRWEYEILTCSKLLPGWNLDLKGFFSTINDLWATPQTAN